MNTKLELWFKLQGDLKALKEKEGALREDLFVEFFGENAAEGTHKADLGDGYILEGGQKYTRKIDPEMLEHVPFDIVQKATRISHSINKKGYDLLDGSERSMFDDCVITKPSKPTLKIKEKK